MCEGDGNEGYDCFEMLPNDISLPTWEPLVQLGRTVERWIDLELEKPN